MSIAEDAKRVYDSDLKDDLEAKHHGHFVAIEPKSRSHFVGETFIEAALAAKRAYPDRRSFVLRIGHEAAFHMACAT